MKICKDCGEEKSLDDFHKKVSAPDGHCGSCKLCRLEYMRHYVRRPETMQLREEYTRNRGSLPHVVKSNQLIHARYWKAHPDRQKAYWQVRKAIAAGQLVKGPCEACGTTIKIQAHHHLGYSSQHALDVKWFCPLHHIRLEHSQLGI